MVRERSAKPLCISAILIGALELGYFVTDAFYKVCGIFIPLLSRTLIYIEEQMCSN